VTRCQSPPYNKDDDMGDDDDEGDDSEEESDRRHRKRPDKKAAKGEIIITDRIGGSDDGGGQGRSRECGMINVMTVGNYEIGCKEVVAEGVRCMIIVGCADGTSSAVT
jgi:hypothetical protein